MNTLMITLTARYGVWGMENLLVLIESRHAEDRAVGYDVAVREDEAAIAVDDEPSPVVGAGALPLEGPNGCNPQRDDRRFHRSDGCFPARVAVAGAGPGTLIGVRAPSLGARLHSKIPISFSPMN